MLIDVLQFQMPLRATWRCVTGQKFDSDLQIDLTFCGREVAGFTTHRNNILINTEHLYKKTLTGENRSVRRKASPSACLSTKIALEPHPVTRRKKSVPNCMNLFIVQQDTHTHTHLTTLQFSHNRGVYSADFVLFIDSCLLFKIERHFCPRRSVQ